MTGHYTGGYTVTENGSAYDRGVAAGEIAARLAGHDQHFAAINGSIARTADELHQLRLAVQKLADADSAAAATVQATARALEEAAAARGAASERRWLPVSRLGALIIALAALAALVYTIMSLARP